MGFCRLIEQERADKHAKVQEKVQNEVYYFWGRLQRIVSPLLWGNDKMLRDIIADEDYGSGKLHGHFVFPISVAFT